MKQYYKDPVQLSATIGLKQDGNDGVDLTNKVVVITGANAGMGKEITTYAVAKNAKVYMVCRSKERAEQARQDILKSVSSEQVNESNVKILLADVGELDQVRSIVKELQSNEQKVDVLVCNAGVLLNDKKVTSTGMEMTFASHFLGGSYLLSQLLIPQLKNADNQNGKVIYVSSAGMYNTKFPNWETATSSPEADHKYDGQFAYAYAKRGQVLLAEQMTKLQPDITWVSCHPGWAATNAVEQAYGDTKKYLEPMRTPWQGCEGICWLMGGKNATPSELEGGAFYLDRKPQKKHFAGPFFTEGSYTKNTQEEIDIMMNKLQEVTGV